MSEHSAERRGVLDRRATVSHTTPSPFSRAPARASVPLLSHNFILKGKVFITRIHLARFPIRHSRKGSERTPFPIFRFT